MSIAFLSIPILIATFLLAVWIFQLLWNSTLPGLFGWKVISYWTSFKLILMAAILFGGGFRIPLGYGESSTQTGPAGETTTRTWHFGSPSK